MNKAYDMKPDEVRRLRKLLCLTQRELADLLGVKDPRSIGRYERGVQKPSTLFGCALLQAVTLAAWHVSFSQIKHRDLMNALVSLHNARQPNPRRRVQ